MLKENKVKENNHKGEATQGDNVEEIGSEEKLNNFFEFHFVNGNQFDVISKLF
jgi:hypothetical protein